MAGQDILHTTLASVEAALARAVIGSAAAETSWVKVEAKLDDVRVYCRRLRAALVELDGSESAVDTDKARANCRELRVVLLELTPAATIPFHCDEPSCSLLRSPRTTCWLDHLAGMITAHSRVDTFAIDRTSAPIRSPAKAIQRTDPGSSVPKPLARRGRVTALLVRQTIDLLVLVLAYLVYFFVDVQLQIAVLPSIFP